MLGQNGQVAVLLTIRMNEQVDELFLDLVAHRSHTNYHIVQHDAHTDGEQIIKVREGHCPADVEVAAPRNTTRFVAARLPPPSPPATTQP